MLLVLTEYIAINCDLYTETGHFSSSKKSNVFYFLIVLMEYSSRRELYNRQMLFSS